MIIKLKEKSKKEKKWYTYFWMLISLLLILFLGDCGMELSTRYDRIEEDRVRPIAFVYDNNGLAEAAPGDTVNCKVYFAGEKVDSVELSMSISTIANFFGSNLYNDTFSLESYIIEGSKRIISSPEMDYLVFDLVIPPDIIKKRFPENIKISELLSSYIADTIFPQEFKNLKPSEVIEVIENIARGEDSTSLTLLPFYQLTNDTIFSILNGFLQALTIETKIYAKVNNKYKVESILVIRYNSLLAKVIPNIPINRNPNYNWIKCFRVRGLNNSMFDPLSDYKAVDTVYELFPRVDTIEIDVGYQYFLVADSNIFPVDYGYSLTEKSGIKRQETFWYEWLYENQNTLNKKDMDSLMILGNSVGNNIVELLPSLDSRLKEFSLWVVLRDRFIGERLRPVGFNVKYIKGFFSYSEAYKNRYR
ncbi:MAG: hypothetical protein N2053_09480 [Chitinispirillaceae bacterium]|nr:hypothetical protein [Chitinispirillaceae bacterium]